MADWLSSMQRTYEYYTVDPATWKDVSRIDNVISCSINRDLYLDTLGSATIDITDSVGEEYIRVYLVTNQNGVKERHPLGTFLVQTPRTSFDGKIRSVSMDAYTPLIELKENGPIIGYNVRKDSNIMETAYRITRESMRPPVIEATSDKVMTDHLTANVGDTWCDYIRDLISLADYELALDELGRVLFSPKQDISSLQPVWTYNDDNSSILYADLSMDHDLYGIPNVVEVTHYNGSTYLHSRVVNDDPNSPTSTVRRGREIVYRTDRIQLPGIPNQEILDEYAESILRGLSSVEYSITYTHGYCPVRLGDCIRLNYSRAGLTNIKAKVISQSIKCDPECSVTEKAIFTTKLWR